MGEYTEFETFTDYEIFDCDQHMYEPDDCCTSFIEAAYVDRTLRPGTVDGRKVLVADQRHVPLDHQGDGCVRPGSLKEMLKAMKAGTGLKDGYQHIPMDPAFVDPAFRRTQLKMQNVDGAIMFCGNYGLFAEPLLSDPDVYWATSWAYLRWLESTWGFDGSNGIFTSPVISMRDIDKACEQLDWIFERGGRSVSICPGPAYGRSPGDPYFDRLWGRIAEAGAIACYHINEAMPGYKSSRSVMWGQNPDPTFYTQSAWQWMWAYGEQPAVETLSALIYDNLFARFPTLKILSAEHGAEWVPALLRRMDKMRGMGRNGPWTGGPLTERPSDIFKRHIRVVPYWEDDLPPLVEALGREVLVGGSDFPHSEGIAFPTQLVEHLTGVSPADQRYIMRDNARSMFGLG